MVVGEGDLVGCYLLFLACSSADLPSMDLIELTWFESLRN